MKQGNLDDEPLSGGAPPDPNPARAGAAPPRESWILARNVGVNLAGQVAPALAALVALPVLARALGAERLGVLNVAWVVIGYFSILDLGIGRALTQTVAATLGSRDPARIPALVWTAWSLLAVLGAAGGAATAAAAPWLARSVLGVPEALRPDVLTALYVVALVMPAITLSSAARGVLEAQQLFVHVNAVRVPLGVATYAGPALVLPFTDSVVASVAVIAAARAIATVAFIWLCLRKMPALRLRVRPSRTAAARLVSSGAWMTLANVAAAIMLYADRFVVGGLLPLAAFAYYATPQEAILKLAVIPAAFSTVMFPAFSAAFASERAPLDRLFARSANTTLVVLFPVTFAIAVFAPELLRVWLGPAFAANSVRAVQFFAVGTLVNGLAATPFALLQAVGRARTTGLLQLVELPIYLAVLWVLTRSHGIDGAAAAWALRVLADAVILFLASGVSLAGRRGLRNAVGVALVPLVFLIVLALPGLWTRVAFFVVSMAAFAPAGWGRLDPEDRRSLAGAWAYTAGWRAGRGGS